MLIEDLIGKSELIGTRDLQTIRCECSTFIRESGGLPLYRNLSTSYQNFQKVKVRQQKRKDAVNEVFDKAFGSSFYNLRQRAVFAYPDPPATSDVNVEPFYVFPVNNFKFLYSKEVNNSSTNYQEVIAALVEQFVDNNEAVEIVTDLLKYTYVKHNLLEGIASNSEIILYGIPHFYAVRVSAVSAYNKLLTP